MARKTKFDRSRLLIGTYCIADYARSEAHVRDMKNCGIDFLTSAPADPGLLDNCKKYGIGVVATGILPGWWGGDGDNAGTMAEKIPLEKVREAADKLNADPFLKDHPALWGIDAGDEPSALDFPHYGKLIALAEELFPDRLVYLNLYPNYASVAENTGAQTRSQLGVPTYSDYIDAYMEHVKNDYLCLDNYEFAAGIGRFYPNLKVAADACLREGRDFWMVIQVNSSKPDVWLSKDQLRHQAFTCMAYGAVALNWACWTAGWFHNEVLDGEGRKTEQYEKLKTVNAEIRALEPLYMAYRNTGTVFLGKKEAADDAALESGTPVVGTYSNAAFLDVRAGDGCVFALGDMTARENRGNGAGLFLADVTDTKFAGNAGTRSFSFRLAPGYRPILAGDAEIAGGEDGVYSVSCPAYAGVMLAAEKQK
ncbi:MAG: hypothetical protein K6A33_06700 [Clostridiales bacterium]|nr:hypothetical protein [Clostridiales bacterium]